MDESALFEIFRLSSLQQLAQAETALLDLESSPSSPAGSALEVLFRAVHTVKGDAGSLKLTGLSQLCHSVENALSGLRGEGRTLSPGAVTSLLVVLDALKQAVESGQDAPMTSLRGGLFAGLLEDVAAHARSGQPAARAACAGPAPQEEPQPQERGAGDFTVQAEQLDQMIGHANEIMLLQSRLAALAQRDGLHEYAALADELAGRNAAMGRSVLAMRMMPFSRVVPKYRRIVRDVSVRTGKSAELRVSGELTELDKTVVEKLNVPLVHLLRNAVGHGLETPEQRALAGKPPTGVVSLDARQEGGEIVIAVSDDGAGIDPQAVLKRARGMGLAPQGHDPTPHEALELVFLPGLTTSEAVDDISGRGVGLDAVRAALAALGGSVAVESEPGRGTCFTLRLPVALTLMECLRLSVADQQYFLPLECVLHCQEGSGMEPGTAAHLGNFSLFGRKCPCLALDVYFGLRERSQSLTMVAARLGGAVFGICVDGVPGLAQVMVKQLDRPLTAGGCFLGAALNDEGGMSLIVDPRHVLRLLHPER
ncbi:chemotaxis protein CheA [Fundidesulfovibrio soli]|uniref:chemotaxis protein CheA n=1 Tax=Fundidesulfovibrio soli TaxID=2922716 RepID=UPI001FAFDA35|nr:ATP-binding protein [Fundidesulfovibrio soli]